MKKHTLYLFNFLFAGLLLTTSCSKDDPDDPPSPVAKLETYTFKRNGKTSVDHSGQDARLDMLSEIEAKVKKAATEELDATKLKEMYGGKGFTDAALNSSGKQLKDKTFKNHQAYYDKYLEIMADLSKLRRGASGAKAFEANKAAGYVQRSTSSPVKDVMVNALGLEVGQMLVKGIMGSTFYYQIVGEGGYLEKVINAANDKVVDGKNYTLKEHYFDEAFGYIGFPHDYLTKTAEFAAGKYYRFWAKYIHSRGAAGIKGVDKSGKLVSDNIAKTIFKAFIAGRKAIVDKKDDVLKEQIDVIRRNLEKVTFAQALSYVNKGQDEKYKDDIGTQLHNYSEAVAFSAAPEYIKDAQYKKVTTLAAILKGLVFDKRSIDLTKLDSGPVVYGSVNVADMIKPYVEEIQKLYPDLK